jgi:hypothetical protein
MVLPVISARAQVYDMQDYFPLAAVAGRNLQYHYTSSESDDQVGNVTLTGGVNIDGHDAFIMQYRLRPDVWVNYYYAWTPDYIVQLKMESSSDYWQHYANPLELSPRYLDASTSGVLLGDGGLFVDSRGQNGFAQERITCLGIEEITIPAGTFDALHIKWKETWTNGTGETDAWMVRGFGVVKRHDQESNFNPITGQWTSSWRHMELFQVPIIDPGQVTRFANQQRVFASGNGNLRLGVWSYSLAAFLADQDGTGDFHVSYNMPLEEWTLGAVYDYDQGFWKEGCYSYKSRWYQGETVGGSEGKQLTEPALDPLQPVSAVVQNGLDSLQTSSVISGGVFTVGSWDYATAQWAAKIDSWGSASLFYEVKPGQWYVVCLYDFARSQWTEGIYLYRDVWN